MRRARPAGFFFAAEGSVSDPDDVDVIHRVCLPCPLGPGTPAPSHLWQLPAENPGALSASSQPYWGVNSISIRS